MPYGLTSAHLAKRQMDPIALTIGQMFEIEKFSREIDSSKDVEELQLIAKNLLVAWKQQQAASAKAAQLAGMGQGIAGLGQQYYQQQQYNNTLDKILGAGQSPAFRIPGIGGTL